MSTFVKMVPMVLALSTLGGCWNGGNDSIDLGDVSIGRQMMDLKKALDQEAITQDEYEQLKQALMTIATATGAKKKD